MPDSLEEGLRYLDAIVSDEGRATSARRAGDAFLEHGPEMVRFLRQRGFAWCRAETYPDYYPDAPGRQGRAQHRGRRSSTGGSLGPLLATHARARGARRSRRRPATSRR